MGIKENVSRFEDIGEDRREDLLDFIKYGNLQGGKIQIPIKIVSLPEFVYDEHDQGGVAKGDGDIGDPIPGQPGDGDGDGEEAGEGSGEHGYYDMDPEEFAEELDEELGLDLEPKGKKVKEEVEGAMVERVRTGPNSTIDFDRMFKKGLKRTLAFTFDEEYLHEVLKVEGYGPSTAFEWARYNNIPVSKRWLEEEYKDIPESEKTTYASLDEIGRELRDASQLPVVENIEFREEDKRHKYPKTVEKYERNAVVVFIRDVSGSMRQEKRDLVERVFTPLDWYLTGKYDNAEFIYIAHDYEAWETTRDEFFGIRSGGGTMISSAYRLAQELLEERYPWRTWNRYVFAAGDGENYVRDSEENVIPLMEDIDANLHAYVQVEPRRSHGGPSDKHADILYDHFGPRSDNVAVAFVKNKSEVVEAIYEILDTENDNE